MKKSEDNIDYNVQFAGFDNLMPYRVRKILLVASPYDSSVIADDNRLTELIFSEYLDLNLQYTPQISRVSTAGQAVRKIRHEEFDIIITMMRAGGGDVMTFAKKAKEILPGVSVVVLAYNRIDIQHLPIHRGYSIDYVFLWNGDARILLSIIKLVEDRHNINCDIKAAGIKGIILVENSVRFYSVYLPILYTEIMRQTQLLIAEGLNLSHKLLRMRARPKILLATDYEEASDLYVRYKKNVLGIISDIQFPRKGKTDPRAGIRLAKKIKKEFYDMPILLQSSADTYAEEAKKLGTSFLNKNSKSMLEELSTFVRQHLGFGNFDFRLPDGTSVGSAKDIYSLVELLHSVPDESLLYHASRNHFSNWLMARTEFELANKMRPVKVSEFKNAGELRKYLIENIGNSLHRTEKGVIVDFNNNYFDKYIPFAKIGAGSLGGKARGLAFFNSLMKNRDFSQKFENAEIAIPNMTVIATDIFDIFMSENRLYDFVRKNPDDKTTKETFLKSRLPHNLTESLKKLISEIDYPLSVRSSSIMEDSQSQPFAGIYETYMIPNSHSDENIRLEQLCSAIKLVYASTFSQSARAYLGSSAYIQEEEKMAVIIQRLAGRLYEGRFYPDVSGVAQSYNFYPVPPIKPNDGLVQVALGLGFTIVEGRKSLKFSPAHPKINFQFSSTKDYLDNSQQEFMALDMKHPEFIPTDKPSADISIIDVQEAAKDDTLTNIASTYCADDDRFYEGVARQGPKIITFAPVLQSDVFPLADILKFMLKIGRKSMGCEVEMEFAVDLKYRTFYILQIKPMASFHGQQKVDIENIDTKKIICHSPKTLGHGIIDDLYDIIYVKPENFDPKDSAIIASEIGRLNETLGKRNRKYILIGPGRWGSADTWLGIPVKWANICNAKVMVETTLENFVIDPSYGTHFMHNVISLGIGYFILNHIKKEGEINWKWLKSAKSAEETTHLKHISLKKPLDIRIDSKTGNGFVSHN